MRRRHPGGAWRNTISSHGIKSSVHGLGCTVWRRNSCRSSVEPSWGTTTISQNGWNNNATTLGELVDIRWWATTMALHLSTATTASSISPTGVAFTSCITHIECQCIQTFNDVVEGLMCCTLHSRNLGHLLVLELTGVTGHGLGQLTLIGQSCNLCGDCGSD